MIQIPAGDTLLEWNIKAETFAGSYRGNGLLYRYSFEPEKQYFFYLAEVNGAYGLTVYAYDYDVTITARQHLHRDYYVEFVPFVNIQKNIQLN